MTTTTTPKRGRGRPRLYATIEQAAQARLARIARRREDEALRKRIAKADAEAATQKSIDVLLVTVAQAAQALQVSDRTIHKMIADGSLSSIQIRGSRRIHSDELRRLASTGTTGGD
jgi:excisionase family DNA binding protein